MYDTGNAMGMPELPWFLLGLVGFITLFALYWQFNPRTAAPAILRGG
jgi:DHA1 family multidrug resistance protein-like MFS transporter